MTIMKNHIDTLFYSPLCPNCDEIVNTVIDTTIPEFCPSCGYDLKKPIPFLKALLHNFFWFGESHRYPLAHYKYNKMELKMLKRMWKLKTHKEGEYNENNI